MAFRNEVTFSGAKGSIAVDEMVAFSTKLREALQARKLESTVDEGGVELRIPTSKAALRLIGWDSAPMYCTLRLIEEPIENDLLTETPDSKAVLGLMHELLASAGYDQEWIGEEDDDLGDSPFS
jgi:hypothetical protein